MEHAVKQEIVSNPLEMTYLLYIEIEPQPPEWVREWADLEKQDASINSPISIGDTVYHGEEWGKHINGDIAIVDKIPIKYPKPPETMPIELADKTFIVVGIEVGLRELDGNIVLNPSKWFWKYSLEEI